MLGPLGPVCRLGLSTRGNTHLAAADVLHALDHGLNYWNWCGYPDGMSRAVRHLDARRGEVVLATQLNARDARGARRELDRLLRHLQTDYLDVVTHYYLETIQEWRTIRAPDGAAVALDEARRAGKVRSTGVTSHQRPLAAQIVRQREADLLMIRYNAAHRGAEHTIFPHAQAAGLPVVAYTAVRWGALLSPTPDDPPGFVLPTAAECYRWVLDQEAVDVVLMAPDGRAQLGENLAALRTWRPLDAERYAQLAAHGDRVRRYAGRFP